MTARAIEGHGGVSNKAHAPQMVTINYWVPASVLQTASSKNKRETRTTLPALDRGHISTPSTPRLQRAGEKRSHTAQANHILKKR